MRISDIAYNQYSLIISTAFKLDGESIRNKAKPILGIVRIGCKHDCSRKKNSGAVTMNSQTYALLTSIWSGASKPVETGRALPLRNFITGLLPVHLVVLQVPDGPLSGRVFADDTELMPSLPLGDVIEEEFSASVPAGSIIICVSESALSPNCQKEKRSELLGQICASIIVDTIFLGNYPIEFEMEAFQHLAESVVATAMSVHADQNGIILSHFAIALAQRLDSCLLGRRSNQATDGPFVQHLCRPVQDLSSPIVLDALRENNECYDLSTWASSVAGTMNVQIDLSLGPKFAEGKEASKSTF